MHADYFLFHKTGTKFFNADRQIKSSPQKKSRAQLIFPAKIKLEFYNTSSTTALFTFSSSNVTNFGESTARRTMAAGFRKRKPFSAAILHAMRNQRPNVVFNSSSSTIIFRVDVKNICGSHVLSTFHVTKTSKNNR